MRTAIALCPFEPQGEFRALWQRDETRTRLGCPMLERPSSGYWAEQRFERGSMYWSSEPDLFVVTIGNGKGSWYLIRQSEATWPWSPGTSCQPQVTPEPGTSQPLQPVRGFGGVWCFYDDMQAQIGFATADEFGTYGNLWQEFEGGYLLRDSRGNVYLLLRDGGANRGSYLRERY
jgi:hypothetical protein